MENEFDLPSIVTELHKKYADVDIIGIRKSMIDLSGMLDVSHTEMIDLISKFVEGQKEQITQMYKKNNDSITSAERSIRAVSNKLANKVTVVFADNVEPYNPLSAMDNIFAVVEGTGFPNSLLHLDMISDIITAERAPFRNMSYQHIGVVPYVVEKVFPQVLALKTADARDKALSSVLMKTWDLVHDANTHKVRYSNDPRIVLESDALHKESIEKLEQYILHEGILVSNPYTRIESAVKSNDMVRYNGAYLEFHGVKDSGSRIKSVKLKGASIPTTDIDLTNAGSDVFKTLKILGEYLQPHLKAGTVEAGANYKAIQRLEQTRP